MHLKKNVLLIYFFHHCLLGFIFLMTAFPIYGQSENVSDTKFSSDRGFFESSFNVEITSKTENATIHYTLDNTDPSPNSGLIYSEPILITTTTTLKAIAFKGELNPTNVDAQTYIFLNDVIHQDGSGLPEHANWGHSGPDWEMDPDVVGSSEYKNTIIEDLKSIPSISLSMPFDDWFSQENGIYIQGEKDERAVSFELIFPDGTKGVQVNASVQMQGGSSTRLRWKTDKLSMRIDFKKLYGPTKLNYQLFKDSEVEKFDTIILDSVLNYSWLHPDREQQILGQNVRDQFVADLQNAAGGFAPHGFFAHLYINSFYWGLYYIHERPSEYFAKSYLGGENKEDYDIIKDRGELVNGTLHAWHTFRNRLSYPLWDLKNYQAVQELLDIDDFIIYMIINFYVGNTDWPDNNWYASFNRVDPEGRWRFHSWDAEISLNKIDENITDITGPYGIHKELLHSAEYRMKFADHVHTLFFNDGLLSGSQAAEKYKIRTEEIDNAMVCESARWGDNRRPDNPYTRNVEWIKERDRLLISYFPVRSNIVLEQLKDRVLYSNISAPVFNQHGGDVAINFQLSMTHDNTTGDIYYTSDGTDPRDVGGHISKNAKIYSDLIYLTESKTIKARIFKGQSWSALNEAHFQASNVSSN